MIYSHRVRKLSVVISLMIVSGFAGCSGDDDSMVSQCNNGTEDSIRAGEYLLANDFAPGYEHCITVDFDRIMYGWTWIAPADYSGIASYYIHYSGDTTSELPVPTTSLKSITVAYDAEIVTATVYSIAFELSLESAVSSPTQTIMIGVVSFLPEDSAQLVKRVTIDGEEYDLYAEGGSESSYWPYIAFVKVVPTHTGTVNLHRFLEFLEQEENVVLWRNLYSIKCINNVKKGGTGQATISTYFIELAPKDSDL